MMSTATDAAAPRPAVNVRQADAQRAAPALFRPRARPIVVVRVGDILYLCCRRDGRGPDGKPPEGIEAQTKATMDDIGETLKLRVSRTTCSLHGLP